MIVVFQNFVVENISRIIKFYYIYKCKHIFFVNSYKFNCNLEEKKILIKNATI